MTDPFHAHIHTALINPNLQVALDGNAERRRAARQKAYTSLPEDLQVMRRRAHAVRAQTIAHLDEYLEQFVTQAQVNGMHVHHAADAAQAVQIVLEIAHQCGARLVAKSKTMVGEEIEINHALEQAGLEVVETDFGEYIVQLRGERPAHIITPAVHLRRADVAQTFQEKLGLPYTEDIPTLTAAARRILRQTFLTAGLGISGVNFGVAETGSLCLVTNEGNGRMITTLPPVHIALMGIERLVPTLDDLALLLALLPRSATGQKLTVYTSIINRPRQTGELDGAQERHIILVDNGRQAMRSSSLAEALYCIRCGACLNVCPVFQEIGGHAYVGKHGTTGPYPGPIGSVVSPGLFGQPEFGQLSRASSLCGACKEVCPVDINLPELLLRVRAGGLQLTTPVVSPAAPPHVPRALNLALRLYGWAASSPWRFSAAQHLAGIFSRLLPAPQGWLRLPAFTRWGYSRDFPRPALRPFHTRWQSLSHDVAAPYPLDAFLFQEQPSPLGGEQVSFEQVRSTPSAAPAVTLNLLERFQAELAAVGGTFTQCSPEQVAAEVLTILSARQISAIQAWDASYFPPGMFAALQAGGVRVVHAPDPELRAGLTGALAGIADSGTLLLAGAVDRPLTASLLPEIHLAVIQAGAIYENLPAVLRLREVKEASALTLITGPSRTADIEMTLTIGVHGPCEVHVICMQQDGSGSASDQYNGSDDHNQDKAQGERPA